MPENKIIFEKSSPGRLGVSLPESDVPEKPLIDAISAELLRNTPVNLPEVTEPQVVRHYINLSTKNHHVDKDFYPLGSCTMKYNPKINDAMSALPGFAGIHPNQPEESVQGALQNNRYECCNTSTKCRISRRTGGYIPHDKIP